MKKVIGLLSMLVLLAGCQSFAPSWDWPEEGVIVEQAYDVPRVGRYWVIGTIKDVIINEDYLYWFKIQDREGRRVWVQVDANTWKAYEVGQHWVKIPEARVRYVAVKDTERSGPNPQRIQRSPTRLMK